MPDAVLERRRAALTSLQRQQIVEAFAAVATAKGYAAATITEIVGLAHVSKTTFYDHFADKEAVYAELHGLVADAIVASMSAALERATQSDDWRDAVRVLVRSRLEVAASTPTFLAQAVIEPQIASPVARAVRDAAAERSAALWQQLAMRLAARSREVAPIPRHVVYAGMAAGVAFINARAPDGPDAVLTLEEPLADVWVRLLRAA